jgi:hypothetical protein
MRGFLVVVMLLLVGATRSVAGEGFASEAFREYQPGIAPAYGFHQRAIYLAEVDRNQSSLRDDRRPKPTQLPAAPVIEDDRGLGVTQLPAEPTIVDQSQPVKEKILKEEYQSEGVVVPGCGCEEVQSNCGHHRQRHHRHHRQRHHRHHRHRCHHGC